MFLISVIALPTETAMAQIMAKIADGITLKASSTTVTEGESITFSGRFYDGGMPQRGATVRLMDSSNANTEIGTAIVSSSGSYSIVWKNNSS